VIHGLYLEIATSAAGVVTAGVGLLAPDSRGEPGRRRRSSRRSDGCLWPSYLPVSGVSDAFAYLAIATPTAGVVAAGVEARSRGEPGAGGEEQEER
jgi:hypothetical protein